MVHALEEDIERVVGEHSWLQRTVDMQKEQLAIFAAKYEEQRIRIKGMEEAVSTALGSLHVIQATAAEVKNFTSYFVESPGKLVGNMESIIDRRKIAHEALAADYRIEDAKECLKD